jgi:hypothetical protein
MFSTQTIDAKEISTGRYEIDVATTSTSHRNPSVDANGVLTEERWEGFLHAS